MGFCGFANKEMGGLCGADSVVEVNGYKACLDHIPDAMAEAMAPIHWFEYELGARRPVPEELRRDEG